MQIPSSQVKALLSLREGVQKQQTEPPGIAFIQESAVFTNKMAEALMNFSVEAKQASKAFKGLEMAITTGFGDAVKRSIGES